MVQFIVGGAGKNTHPTTTKGYSDHSTIYAPTQVIIASK